MTSAEDTSTAPAAPKRFCSAPWTQGVLYMDGMLRPCCRNRSEYGSYVQIGLKSAWHSGEAQRFRRAISEGSYPDDECRSCNANGTTASLERDVFSTLRKCIETIGAGLPDVAQPSVINLLVNGAHRLCKAVELTDDGAEALAELRRLSKAAGALFDDSTDPSVEMSVRKLDSICNTVQDFFEGSLTPRSVVPFRQVQLIAICNARCMHCPGLFTGEIARGVEVDGALKKLMLPDEAERAFEYPDDITDFFANGSEFLMFPDWRKITETLHRSQIRFSVSTNGILLTKNAVDFLFSKDYLAHLNVSLDGGTKETIERIRVNVSYDRVMKHLEYLIGVAAETQRETHIGVSFVLMKNNFRELPQLILLLEKLRGEHVRVPLSILLQSFDESPNARYHGLLEEEHISQADRDEVLAVLRETSESAAARNIHVRAFYTWPLEEFLEQGLSLPSMPAAYY